MDTQEMLSIPFVVGMLRFTGCTIIVSIVDVRYQTKVFDASNPEGQDVMSRFEVRNVRIIM